MMSSISIVIITLTLFFTSPSLHNTATDDQPPKTSTDAIRRPSGATKSSEDGEAVAGYIRSLHVESDPAVLSESTDIEMKPVIETKTVISELPQTTSATPVDLAPLGIIGAMPSWTFFGDRVNATDNPDPSDTLPLITSISQLAMGILPPLFSSPDKEAAYVDEDGKEKHEDQLGPSSVRDIESLGQAQIRPETPTEGLFDDSLQVSPMNRGKFTSPRDHGVTAEPTALGIQSITESSDTASVSQIPVDLAPLGITGGMPSWTFFSDRVNTTNNLGSSDTPPPITSFSKLAVGVLPPLSSASVEMPANPSHIQLPIQNSDSYVEGDGKEKHEDQQVSSSVRDIDTLSPAFIWPQSPAADELSYSDNPLQVSPMNRNKFTATTEFPSPPENPAVAAPVISVPPPPPDVIPPSTTRL